MYCRSDVFPRKKTAKVEKLSKYPKFGSYIGRTDVSHFCLYMDHRNRIYYQKRELSRDVIKTCYGIGRQSKILRQFDPNAINFARVYERYRRKPIQSTRNNADTRTGFKMGSDYLVKHFFTFGQRVVKPGDVHVIQTLAIPILFYLRPTRCGDPVKNGLFPTKSLFKYDRRILEPFTQYRIPPGCVYVLFCVQKTFFRVDLADEKDKLFENIRDPVRERIVRLRDLYDEPVETPYIEDQNEEENKASTYLGFSYPTPFSETTVIAEELSPASSSSVEDIHEFLRPQPVEPSFEQQQQQSSNFEQQQLPTFEQQQQQQQQQLPTFEQQQQQQQPTTYILIQTPLPPIRETSVVRVAPEEFVSTYRRLSTRTVTDPKENFDVDPDCNWNPEPIDLTVPPQIAVVVDLEEDNNGNGCPNEAEPVSQPADLPATEPEPMNWIEPPSAPDEFEWNPAASEPEPMNSIMSFLTDAVATEAQDKLEWSLSPLIAAAAASEEGTLNMESLEALHRQADQFIHSIC